MTNNGQKNTRSRKRKLLAYKRFICVGLLVIAGVILFRTIGCEGNSTYAEPANNAGILSTGDIELIQDTESTQEPIQRYDDPNNRVFPYSLMSADWGGDVYAEGYTYYEIPRAYAMGGGMFPEVAQIYLWSICKDAGVDYYTVLALIERESGYKCYATGDSGKSKGLMQIQERWHIERMEALGVEDLYNPYVNMLVGVNYLKEIQDRYLESSGEHCVLMVYNMGASGARKLWAEGKYSTAYSTQILQRAQEIRQALQDQ